MGKNGKKLYDYETYLSEKNGIIRRLQRWANNKRLFYTVKDFKNYDPGGYRKG